MAHRLQPALTLARRRRAERQRLSVAARLTWKDASGAMRFVSVTTRDVSSAGVFVEAEAGAAIPLYRLVHVQLERPDAILEGVHDGLRAGRVLAAIWRVAPCRAATGTPAGYALRFLAEPHENARASHAAPPRMAVAS